jgi:DNA-binding NarL/FixJ family response regulator
MTFRALIVEDDSSWQQILNEILVDHGLEVDLATDFNEAVTALKERPHRLAVVDLSLSPNDHNNYDGLRVLDNIRKLDPNCRAILLTGFATVELAVTALTDYGAFTFLRKESFQRSQFREIVNRILVSAPQAETSKPAQASAFSSRDALFAPVKLAPKVLIVDDDAGWRSILEDLLSEAGFQPSTSSSFGEALASLRREKFSLAVVDLSLKEVTANSAPDEQNLTGYQLLKIAQENHIPTIVVSGLSEPEEIQRIYKEHGISAYIEKQTFNRTTFKRILAETKTDVETVDELSVLTDREREVLDLLAQGLTNKEIAEQLFITTNTVKRHLKAVFEKLDVHTRSAATAKVAGDIKYKSPLRD